MVLCGDFNSLPFKRHSDAFDTGGCCAQFGGCYWQLWRLQCWGG
jgi:hypothetical protein